ncbi:MAG TPA: class I SAM-dependent methyltransferase [Patescibacteria group bacterium]|nr:class I SAM-dependent methyltransferase [Patescibacteria group bacterium]
MKEARELAGLIVQAANWYRKPAHEQYTPPQVPVYDTTAARLTGRRAFGKLLVEHFLPEEPGVTLEIAAGTGLISEALASRIDPEQLFLSDTAPAALALLWKRLSQHAQVLYADFFNLPFADMFVNTLICVGGYRYVDTSQTEAFWSEMNRILAPGATGIFAEFHPIIRRISGNQLRGYVLPHNMSLITQATAVSHEELFGIPSGRYIISVIRKK